MNKYVNTNERTHLLRLGAIMAAMDDAVAVYKDLKNVDKTFLKYLRTTGTFALKALSQRMKHLDDSAVVKLAGETRNHIIVLKTRSEMKIERAATEKANEVWPVKTDDLLDLIEITIGSTCQKCDGSLQKECRLKALFMSYGVEALDANPPEGRYPYQYLEGGAEE